MAICSRCGGEMGQTQALCPKCGYDFPDPRRSLSSRLTDWAWKCVALIILVLLCCRWWPGFYEDIVYTPHPSLLNQVPPEFSPTGQWINVQHPLTLAELRGKVVWLAFSFLR